MDQRNKDKPRCCQGEMERDVVGEQAGPLNGPISHAFESGGLFLEHADENGRTFKSRGELSRWCKENGVASGALL